MWKKRDLMDFERRMTEETRIQGASIGETVAFIKYSRTVVEKIYQDSIIKQKTV